MCTCIFSLYAFFWVIPGPLNFIWRRFGTHCLFHLHKQVGMKNVMLGYDGVFIRGKVWLEPNIFPYKYPNMS